MTNWGAVSSWVAAGISVTAFGAGTVRSIWNRPQVDWALRGEIGWPHYHQPGSFWMEGMASFSNFGDGPAHRVAVHIHRGDAELSQVLASSPLVRPGEAIEFTAGCVPNDWDSTYLWVAWTPPPIRRHRERTSTKLLAPEHLELTRNAEGRLKKFREEQQASGS